jgi:hypothetical protein
MSHAFCSRLAQAADGVIPGTGVRGDIYVFLPVEKRWWGHSEFNAGWATPDEIDAIRLARRSGVTTRLYDPPSHRVGMILAHRSPTASAEASTALTALLQALLRHDWALDDSGAPRLALCTQGTRDRCCAKWGFAVYRQAMKLHADGRLPLEPIECSHLGGDRFAATGIAFPSGGMYGHLDRIDLTELAAAEAEDRILPGHYRGRVFEDSIVQIVREGLAKDGLDVAATSPLTVTNPQDAPGPLDVSAAGRRYEVRLALREIRFFGDCRSVLRDKGSRESRLFYECAREVPAQR